MLVSDAAVDSIEWEGTEEVPEEPPEEPEIMEIQPDVTPVGGEFPEDDIYEHVLVEEGVYDE